MLRLTDLSKSFYDPGRGPVRAVDGLSAELGGGVTALVGANGAGKSTLLRCLATLLQPDRGGIHLHDLDVLAQPLAARRKLGYLSTSTRLYPKLTGREVLQYSGGFFGLYGEALRQRIEAVSADFSLRDFLDQRCESLSTGQSQRVNLARTLLADPDLLILDEPTTGLDLVAARQVVRAVEAARQRQQRIIIIATHIVAEVEECADRLLIMAAGRFVFDGAPQRLGQGAELARAIHAYIEAPSDGETARGS